MAAWRLVCFVVFLVANIGISSGRFRQDENVIQMSQTRPFSHDEIVTSLYKSRSVGLSFASYYGDHMVLQRAPARATIWGYSNVLGDTITLTIGKQKYSTKVVQGPVFGLQVWKVMLDPVSDQGPYNITVSSRVSTATIHDVLFGDVWLCSGQSNMQFTVDMLFNASKELEDAGNYTQIRVFTAAEVASGMPLYDLALVQQPWEVASKDALGNGAWTYFSAVCWLYGKYLYQHLKYPIGLVATDWGGTPIEAWSSPRALTRCGLEDKYHVPKDFFYASETPKLLGPAVPTVLWNAMIHPFLNMTIYGAIWYQGEANAAVVTRDLYNCTFPSMIDDWRDNFHTASGKQTNQQFPFGFVQLAAWRNESILMSGFPDIRWHQTADFGYVPNYRMQNTFMAVAMDLPDNTSPYNPIHPRDKQDVAKRLVLSARAVAYGNTKLKFQGPWPSAYYIDIGFYTLGIEYDNTTTQLDVRSNKGFEVCCTNDNQTYCDETSLEWFPALVIHNTLTRVTLSYNTSGCAGEWIMGLRYAWRETPCEFKKCAVYSVENQLPAPPFVQNGLFGGQLPLHVTKFGKQVQL